LNSEVNLLSNAELHSKIRDINIECDSLVIGSTLEALIYCFLNNIPLVCSRLNPPFRFEYFNVEDDLSIFGMKNISQTKKTNLSETIIGMNKIKLWERLFFYLSAAGLCFLSDKAVSLRVSGNIVKAHTATARMAKVNFNDLIIFDDRNVHGLGTYKIEDKIFTVYDWFDVRSGMKHNYDQIEDTTDFVNHILFYPSDRVAGDHNFKDAIAVSYLTKEMLTDFEYSDINARFKTRHLMKQNGIRGARNGRDMLDKTKFKYYAVKIENTKREIIEPINIYESTDNITFNYDSLNDIIEKNPLQESYVSKIIQRIS
tara:strand:+ start:124 stop:1065 length:942 start_codon:yes stop_codon:yes gene_type:complete